MPAISDNWQHSTPDQPRKRRAELVCTTCHSKKIKCDLQGRKNDGFNTCSYCSSSGRDCELRTPKRAKRRETEANGNFVSKGQNDPRARLNAERDRTAFETATRSTETIAGPGVLRRQHEVVPLQQAPVDTPQQDNGRVVVNEAYTGDLDTGFLQVYGQETHNDARNQSITDIERITSSHRSAIPPDLLPIFADAYFDNCYAWCPVLDRVNIYQTLAGSPLLTNALALAASHVQPPMLPHDGPSEYYNRARRMFYDDEEPSILTCLKALLMFYWWAPRSTSAVHRHSSWWWTSIVIRHAQMMDLHREPPAGRGPEDMGLRRRIWWTAFARERLTALCQSKPAIIDSRDCNILEPTLQDFPPKLNEIDRTKAEVFIHWVKLCGTIGRIAQHLSRTSKASSPFPRRLADELISWSKSLPTTLILPISASHTPTFNKDVHQLYLPYLCAIVVLHLKRPSGLNALPQALPPAIMAATCMARIFKDILARGETRFLMAITSWYCGISFIALLSASQDPQLAEAAASDLEIVVLTCKHLRTMWASANVIYNGFDRLRSMGSAKDNESPSQAAEALMSINGAAYAQSPTETLYTPGSLDWMEYFGFVTRDTSRVAALLLASKENNEFGLKAMLPDSSLLDLGDWFDQLGDGTDFVLADDANGFVS